MALVCGQRDLSGERFSIAARRLPGPPSRLRCRRAVRFLGERLPTGALF